MVSRPDLKDEACSILFRRREHIASDRVMQSFLRDDLLNQAFHLFRLREAAQGALGKNRLAVNRDLEIAGGTHENDRVQA